MKWVRENYIGIIGFFILMAIGILGFAIISAGFCSLFDCSCGNIDGVLSC